MMCVLTQLTTLHKGKRLEVYRHLKDNLYLATYEDIIETSKGITNQMIVRKSIIEGEEHYFLHCWYGGNDNLEDLI